MNAVSTIQDSHYSWFRLAVSLALATIGGIGIWAGIVVLPFIQVEFGVDRSGASFPYTMSMIGFALGGVLMGRLADRFGIMVPMFIGSIMLGLGFHRLGPFTKLLDVCRLPGISHRPGLCHDFRTARC